VDIRELRKQSGLSQESFARKIGVSIMTIRRWENGQTPSALALVSIKLFIESEMKKKEPTWED